MIRIGLTGGVASGKSEVAALFAARGATVIDTDQIARQVVEPGQPSFARLVEALGRGILGPDDRVDRRLLRRRIFEDVATRRIVEEVLHPAILAQLDRQAEAAPGPYQIHVIPLLAESGLRGRLDRILVVDCPEEQQIERLMCRDGESREDAMRALAAQATRAERLAIADDVIVNDGDLGQLEARVAVLDERYRQLGVRV